MKRNKSAGVSLVEIIVAVMVFAMASIPLYYAISYGASEETNLEKVAIANKILAAFRDEIKNLDYKTVEGLMTATSNWKTLDASALPPNSFNSLLTSQKKYKDFEFKTEVRKSPGADLDSLEFKAAVSWTTGRGNTASESIAFIKVNN
ncbi:MAG: prepilin-type N-terminal cleavage/methylation domain-containing protein [Candidatus Riflebacteria bacterium]|jgi:hypothetical protein|nr:prepilin-type N-terminal cleavage/methylation domain-containing protein [Candidatus Riflebacteria bacterium]